MRWHGLVRCSLRLPSLEVVPSPNTFRDFRNWKPIEPAAHVAARIAVLQAPGKNQVQSRSGNHAQLAKPGNGPCQPPIGDGCAHPALNDCRKIAHDETQRDRTFSQGWTNVIV